MPIFRFKGAGALLLAHGCAFAQSAPAPIQQVVVTSGAVDARTQSTTTAIVVRREELERHGDTALADALKRQPGITIDTTPGKPAAIRMRGMGSGYAAILLNGVPAPNGFALESVGVEQIERIEILRAATAETGAQAMAGTINVILRRAGPAKGGHTAEVKAGGAIVDGRFAPHLFAQRSGRSGALAYSLAATLRRNENPVDARTSDEGRDPSGGTPSFRRHTALFDHMVEDVLELAPRLAWQAEGGDTLSAHGYLRERRIDNAKRERESVEIGAPTRFPHADSNYATRPRSAYAELAWTRHLEHDGRLSAKLSGFHTARDADFLYRGMDARGRLLETHRVASGPVEREWTFSGSWRRQIGGRHALAAGWELGRKGRHEYRREQQSDAGGAPLLATDEHYRARVERAAFFVQDEWDIDAAWSAYLGLRRETLRTTGAGNAHAPVDVDAGAWSPILQLLFKPDAPAGAPRDSLRFALTRTYKAPNIVQLMPRRYTVDNHNSATNPDQQGNPHLRPELALGIDLAWERSFGKRGMFSLGAFHKRIRDITLERIDERAGVWVATPDNRGKAVVAGLEFDARATHGALTARANLARNWSRVDSLPAPHNRIEGQPAYSANLGLDYAPVDGRIEAGGTWTARGRAVYRASAQLLHEIGPKRQLDLYAVWKRDATSRLRLSVSDLLHRDYRERSTYAAAPTLLETTTYRMHATWRLVWEQSL